MAFRTALRPVLVLTEPWSSAHRPVLTVSLPAQLIRPRVRVSTFAPFMRCSRSDVPSPAFSQDEQDPPQEAVLKVISEVSKSEGRVSQTTNVIIGGTVKDDATNEWLALDQKVNSYPTVRGFTAIGTGGDDFVNAMVVAVESVLHEPIPEDRVTHKLSSRGKYVSVNIGPIRVVSSEQVQAVYNAMRRDERMKYFL
ncbi:uncharacterized protein LOC110099438 isoform X2 [Dendrobium catenatum]|uniref:Phosphoribosylformylglycinamidine synthase n=2 Tax=Dendrobium TaxID=37818 RepID=A0A8T3BQI3_DENNO|nr:uncharacterized protein LOC110099438 isoform X2 [Dendrobium catenatum]KAI0516116.1 hypothetical protein KFK09_008788 [Dendrobium nobile]PKU75900.1 hypothetical protein MA16_Dca005947 [Dendrobium catenatum]